MVTYKNLCFLLFPDSVGFSHNGHMAVFPVLACLLALLRGFTVIPYSWDTVPSAPACLRPSCIPAACPDAVSLEHPLLTNILQTTLSFSDLTFLPSTYYDLVREYICLRASKM